MLSFILPWIFYFPASILAIICCFIDLENYLLNYFNKFISIPSQSEESEISFDPTSSANTTNSNKTKCTVEDNNTIKRIKNKTTRIKDSNDWNHLLTSLAKVKTAAIGLTAGWFYRSYIPGYFYMIIYLSIQYHAHNIYIILSYVTPTILNYFTVYIIIILS
jgi:hypothetical protein